MRRIFNPITFPLAGQFHSRGFSERLGNWRWAMSHAEVDFQANASLRDRWDVGFFYNQGFTNPHRKKRSLGHCVKPLQSRPHCSTIQNTFAQNLRLCLSQKQWDREENLRWRSSPYARSRRESHWLSMQLSLFPREHVELNRIADSDRQPYSWIFPYGSDDVKFGASTRASQRYLSPGAWSHHR